MDVVTEPMIAYGLLVPNGINALVSRDMDQINLLQDGVGTNSLEAVMNAFDMTQLEMAAMLHTNPKTLRKKIKEHEALDTLQGSLIAALAELFQKGLEVFQERKAFLSWIRTKSVALGVVPFDILDTFQGVQMIVSELDSIAEGNFA